VRLAILSSILGASLLLTSTQAVAQEPDKWAEHKGDLPFVITYEKGKAEAKFTGKPMMVFVTTTW
jgi:hypothetical protein